MEPTAATKLTIDIGDSDKHGRKPLHLAIIELLHEESISGATVVHGIEGYGVHKQIHTARILDLSGDLPVSYYGGGPAGEDRGRDPQARRDDWGGAHDYGGGADCYLPPRAPAMISQ
jgi:hypothetical protein